MIDRTKWRNGPVAVQSRGRETEAGQKEGGEGTREKQKEGHKVPTL